VPSRLQPRRRSPRKARKERGDNSQPLPQGGIILRRLGKVLHVSKRGALILRTEKTPPIGKDAIVVDKKVQKIGWIQDVFGPVKNPYVSIRPFDKLAAEKLLGQILYLYRRKNA
jgi:RNA-binding protein